MRYETCRVCAAPKAESTDNNYGNFVSHQRNLRGGLELVGKLGEEGWELVNVLIVNEWQVHYFQRQLDETEKAAPIEI